MKYEDVFPKGYSDPFKAREGIAGFIKYYNQERPHEALDYVTLEEKYQGLDEEIINRRKRLKEKTKRFRKKIKNEGGHFSVSGQTACFGPAKKLTFFLKRYKSSIGKIVSPLDSLDEC